jgi:hypothetical protein
VGVGRLDLQLIQLRGTLVAGLPSHSGTLWNS